ncbi:MAG: Hsp33 family molecular chaperone HslO [Oceanospirillaceae bacterium]|nr:Hsp33 family molecular chaperone HslO [Oceanospirillaceae bacterium]|tara:strand:+ start:182 stop:1039 length:858 start_codon:yes stop_codon:yes gene_type:complete
MTHPSADLLQRFSFDDTVIRGEIAHLNTSYQEVLDRHQYPDVVARPLGELMAATALLSSSLKFKGRLTLQVRLPGNISLLQSETDEQGRLRAIARYNTEQASDELTLVDGQLVITLEPEQGQRYQGIVAIDGGNVAEALENYFEQSEQLPTRFWLACNTGTAAGFMLQRMPETTTAKHDPDDWNRIHHLATTLKHDELLQLGNETLLHRLYHEEDIRLYPATDLSFYCTCSHPRIATALKQLGEAELRNIIEESGRVEINCDFCQQQYQFTSDDVDEMFAQSKVH